MKLINYDGVDFTIADEALLLRPIRELFRADKSKKKEEFWKQISYLWFMCDPRSPYMYLTKDADRDKEVRQMEGFEEKWKISDTLKDAMEQYRKAAVTTSALLLEDIRTGIDNVRAFFRSVDLNATDDKTGRPVYQVSSVTAAIKQAIELSEMLAVAEKKLAKDYESETATRGSAERALYENI